MEEIIRHITKVKFDGKKFTARWIREDTGDEYELVSTDAPAPEFIDYFQLLVKPAMLLLDLPEAYGESCEVRGLTLKRTEDDPEFIESVLISVLKRDLEAGVANLNTPMAAYPLLGIMALSISGVCESALQFVDGRRHQLDMFAEAEPAEPMGDGFEEDAGPPEIADPAHAGRMLAELADEE